MKALREAGAVINTSITMANLTCMADNGTWGNRQEVSALCHLLHTPVYAYDTATNQWEEMTPGTYSNPPYPCPVGIEAIYIVNINMSTLRLCCPLCNLNCTLRWSLAPHNFTTL